MKGVFICLPRAALSDKRLGFEDLRVLLALWSWRGKNYTVHPTLAMIAERARVSAKHISGVTTKLARLGYIVKTGNGGRGQHVRYTLLEPETSPDSGEVYSETSPDSGEVCKAEESRAADGKTSPDSGEELQNVPRFRGGLEQNVPRIGGETSPASGDPIKETSLRQESAKADVPPISPTQPDSFALEAKPAKRKLAKRVSIACPPEVEPDDWEELLAICKAKRKPMTARVWAGMVEEAEKDGLEPQEMVELCTKKGWARYETGWKANEERKQSGAQYKSAYERKCEAMHQWAHIDEILGEPEKQDNVIDVSVRPANREQFQLLEQK